MMLLLAACPRSVRSPGGADVLVLAPHPDDEVLMAAGVIDRAVKQGLRVEVVLVTNGDFTCKRDGRVRQAETLTALTKLGVEASRVHFLGYPDGHLHELTAEPLAPFERINAAGACVRTNETWSGKPVTSTALLDDLTELLDRLRPADVYLPHGIDTHRDHAATYVFFRRALDRLALPTRAHRSVIHRHEDLCWPGSCAAPWQPKEALPPLPFPLDRYTADERLPVDATWKLQLISAYPSQLDAPLEKDWLAGFARTNEVFFTERYVKREGRMVSDATTSCAGDTCSAQRGDYEELATWKNGAFDSLRVVSLTR
ncbi:MAG: PIG-L family deacetylase [Myxococcaceae bacterium]